MRRAKGRGGRTDQDSNERMRTGGKREIFHLNASLLLP